MTPETETQLRRLLGDPEARLTEAEVLDRVAKLVKVLQQTVGLADAMTLLATGSKLGRSPGPIAATAREIMEVVQEALPEWDDVLKAVFEAQKTVSRGGAELAEA